MLTGIDIYTLFYKFIQKKSVGIFYNDIVSK